MLANPRAFYIPVWWRSSSALLVQGSGPQFFIYVTHSQRPFYLRKLLVRPALSRSMLILQHGQPHLHFWKTQRETKVP